jgi:hypothetical protein
MPWTRLDDGFADDPRIVELDAGSPIALLVLGLVWATKQLTDGWVSLAYLRGRCGDVEAHMVQLERVGLATRRDRDGLSGWQLAEDLVALQPTRAQVERDRADMRMRQQRHRAKQREQAERRHAARTRRGGHNDVTRDSVHASRSGHEAVAAVSPAPDPARPDPDGQDQEPRVGARRSRNDDWTTTSAIRNHLKAAAHASLDEEPDVSDGELAEGVKQAAAACRAVDYNGRNVQQIVDGVRGERARRGA